jgi:transcriptional regulator with XRE-family HTH domain
VPYDWARWGEQVKTLREDRNWTQQDLAQRVKTSRVTIARLEVGIRKPSVHMLERLSDVLQITLANLMTLPRSGR